MPVALFSLKPALPSASRPDAPHPWNALTTLLCVCSYSVKNRPKVDLKMALLLPKNCKRIVEIYAERLREVYARWLESICCEEITHCQRNSDVPTCHCGGVRHGRTYLSLRWCAPRSWRRSWTRRLAAPWCSACDCKQSVRPANVITSNGSSRWLVCVNSQAVAVVAVPRRCTPAGR